MNRKKALVEKIVAFFGPCYSKKLGIDLDSKEKDEIFKWFLASVLFGVRISENIVINTYRVFEKREILTSEKIVKTGWDGIIPVMGEGGYARYDNKTSTKLWKFHEICLKNTKETLAIFAPPQKTMKPLMKTSGPLEKE